MKKIILAATAAAVLLAGPAFAQTAAPAPAAKPAAPVAAPAAPAAPAAAKPDAAKPKMSVDEKKAKSADCSKQADAKGLHGKDRHKFRETCKKG